MVSVESVKKIFAELVAIDSPSLKERNMVDYIKKLFAMLGIELIEDDTAKITGSNAGNLHGYLKGNGKDSILLAVHLDTVMPAFGKKAIFHPNGRITSDTTTVLGADDLSGVTAIYEAVSYLQKHDIKHRDVELLFTIGEELYCKGAKAFDYKKIKSHSALVLDLSGKIGEAAYAAPTILSFEVIVRGKAAHAGFCPEEGIHAIKAVCEGVAALQQGRIDEVTTANIGTILGGEGINIVPEKCVVKGEIRSLNHEKALKVAKEYQRVFYKSAKHYGAQIEWTQQIDVKAYETNLSGKIVKEYKQVCNELNIPVNLRKTFGGSDNNVFAQKGIEGIVIATSMNNVHTCNEYANIFEIAQVADILIRMCEV